MCKSSTRIEKKKSTTLGPTKITIFKEIPTALDPQMRPFVFGGVDPKSGVENAKFTPFLERAKPEFEFLVNFWESVEVKTP